MVGNCHCIIDNEDVFYAYDLFIVTAAMLGDQRDHLIQNDSDQFQLKLPQFFHIRFLLQVYAKWMNRYRQTSTEAK